MIMTHDVLLASPMTRPGWWRQWPGPRRSDRWWQRPEVTCHEEPGHVTHVTEVTWPVCWLSDILLTAWCPPSETSWSSVTAFLRTALWQQTGELENNLTNFNYYDLQVLQSIWKQDCVTVERKSREKVCQHEVNYQKIKNSNNEHLEENHVTVLSVTDKINIEILHLYALSNTFVHLLPDKIITGHIFLVLILH